MVNQSSILGKTLTISVILLFIGVGVHPAIADVVKEPHIPLSKGNILYVGGTGEGNYTKIQDAIDNVSVDGMVYVFDESSPYRENLKIYNKPISLIGENKNTTIIAGKDEYNVISIIANGVSISGFTIRHSGNHRLHAGIYIPSKNNTIYNNIIHKNNGVGILLLSYSSNNNNIVGNIISDNEYDGILIKYGENNTIKNNLIQYNGGEHIFIPGPGIHIDRAQNNTIINNNLINNYLINAVCIDAGKNIWSQNYWNRPRIFPKLISLRGFNIDWRTALKPNKINV